MRDVLIALNIPSKNIYLEPFRNESISKIYLGRGRLTEIMNDNGICRAAPDKASGFASNIALIFPPYDMVIL